MLEKHPNAKRESLIPILQDIQESCGYLSREVINQVAEYIDLPAAKIYGVATFYNQFRFQPLGRYHVMICRGTACHVKGSKKALDMVVKALGIQPGQTSRDGLFSLGVVACMGACGLAPVVNINGEIHAKVTPKKLSGIIAEIRAKELSNAKK
ncbi:MAG TPA: NADH-quinone oxidoreductase subunit NuoE [Phycisphaerales bacterium]|nr:NADH-quinone oxidoreductase subunit NuoE [Phycisphaerales bacterium]HBR20370.1 NADH-quinone oxidoreductase subunit NuoE [Phycisphaerales bacterium]